MIGKRGERLNAQLSQDQQLARTATIVDAIANHECWTLGGRLSRVIPSELPENGGAAWLDSEYPGDCTDHCARVAKQRSWRLACCESPLDEVAPVASTGWMLFAAGRAGGGGAGRGGPPPVAKRGLLSDDELDKIEEDHPDGMTAVEIVDIFVVRGVRFSEATFRKYVQQGLLPRSRRVGRKGKHRGSLGVYPAKTVRRINGIKQLMADGYTIEEIQSQFLRFADVVDVLEEAINEVFVRLESQSDQVSEKQQRTWARDMDAARRSGEDFVSAVEMLARQIARPDSDRYRSPGAAGSAEDLL